MPTLRQHGPIWTLDLGDDENRFSPDWVSTVSNHLDEVASSPEPAALVTIGAGKFYSNGLDLEWVAANPAELGTYIGWVQALFEKVLTLPVPTAAALNGHAFGAGAILAMAHDYRVMREDRGYFCFPEVDIHIPFTPGMAALVMSKVSARTAVDAMTTGRRFGGPDAVAAGLADGCGALHALPERAAGHVRDLAGKDRATLGRIKATMFANVVAALREPLP
jgi:enoyl-CoA hydratase/carnithine racemase